MRGALPTHQLVDTYSQAPGTILSVTEVAPEDGWKYGTVVPGSDRRVAGLAEKPASGTEPSCLASIGRYVLEPEIMDILPTQKPGKGGEIRLAGAINTRGTQGEVRAVLIAGQRYDCGSKKGYLEAVMDFALEPREFVKTFRKIATRQPATKIHKADKANY